MTNLTLMRHEIKRPTVLWRAVLARMRRLGRLYSALVYGLEVSVITGGLAVGAWFLVVAFLVVPLEPWVWVPDPLFRLFIFLISPWTWAGTGAALGFGYAFLDMLDGDSV